jgi:2-dehydro-3-deoxyphosphogluconate aldolase/(4S)-4-hydroxy-2-oxoglutarate aldolase
MSSQARANIETDSRGAHAAHPDYRIRPGSNRHETLARIIDQGVIPVIAGASPEEAVLVLKAICKVGVRVAEITMSGPHGLTVLERVACELGGEVTLGAGAVLGAEAARTCIKAGAEYIASPVLDRRTIDAVKGLSKVMISGALTPTEVATAWESYSDAVRIFPCATVGGPEYVAALKQTFPEIDMLPAGSLNLETTSKFLRAGASAVAVGRAFIDAKTIAEGHYAVFEERARRYLAAAAKARPSCLKAERGPAK